eukprot:m.38062 g.38062  ORF g.38062 m.38062 type:complete len:463 (+) comp12575_c0_seq1:187-1575(+)
MASCFACFRSASTDPAGKAVSRHKSGPRQAFAYAQYNAQATRKERERPLAQNPLLWTEKDCAHWLAARECFEAADNAKHRHVDGEALVMMGVSQLVDLGVPSGMAAKTRQALQRRNRQSSRLSRDVLASFDEARSCASLPTSEPRTFPSAGPVDQENVSIDTEMRSRLEQERQQVTGVNTTFNPALRALSVRRVHGTSSLPKDRASDSWAGPRSVTSLPPNVSLAAGSIHNNDGHVGRPAGFASTTLMLSSMAAPDIRDTGSLASASPSSQRRFAGSPPTLTAGPSRPMSAAIDNTSYGFTDPPPRLDVPHRHSVGAALNVKANQPSTPSPTGLWIDQDIKTLVTGVRRRVDSDRSVRTQDSQGEQSEARPTQTKRQSDNADKSDHSRSSSTSSASSFFRSLGRRAGRSVKSKVQQANQPEAPPASPSMRSRGLTLDAAQAEKMGYLAAELSPSDRNTSMLF